MSQLDIKGNAALSDGDIEERILTTPPGWWPFATKYGFDPVVWATDLKRIESLYASRGYYQAHVVHDRAAADPPDGVDLEIEIHEGEPTRIAALEVLGLDPLAPPDRARLVGGLPLRLSQIFTEGAWVGAQELIRNHLRQRGYATAQVEGEALIDVKTHQAALTLLVRPGEVYQFGDIRLDAGGGSAIQAPWIWDQVRLAIPEGQRFSDDAIEEAQRRVSNMGVFSVVKVTAGAPDPARGRIPVLVETREAPLHTLKLGGGVRIDQIRNEARLIGEWSNRNFLGGMRRLTFHAEAGWAFIPNTYAVVSNDRTTQLRNGPIARTRLEFEQPRFLGRPSLREQSTLELARTLEQSYDDLGGRFSNGVVWQPRASLTIYPSHHLEGDELNGPPGAGVLTSPLTLGCRTTGNSCFVWLSYLEEVITWDRRDNALEPHDGWYVSLSLQQGGGPLLGNFDYYRILPDVRGYVSLGHHHELTFAGRLRVGDLFPKSGDPDDSAVVTRFYAGGAQSMRGFNDRRLSPLLVSPLPTSPGNPNPPTASECLSSPPQGGCVTLPIGGDGLIDGSFEIRYAVTSNLVVAAFLDFGQVTRGSLTADAISHVSLAAGAGLRYLTPIGPVRLDIGRRLPFGQPPPLFAVDPTTGHITQHPYKVDDSCFGLGGSGASIVSDNLCALQVSIGEAF